MLDLSNYKLNTKDAFKLMLDGKKILSKFGFVYFIKGNSIQVSTDRICSFVEFLSLDHNYSFKEFINGIDFIHIYNKEKRTFEKITHF